MDNAYDGIEFATAMDAQRAAERVKQDNRALEERVEVLEKRLREVRILLGLQ